MVINVKMSIRNKNFSKQNELFKEKFEIVDEKYKKMKEIFKQVLRDLKHEREKNEVLQKELSKLSLEVKEKEDLLERMQSVSEAVVDEFSTLKVKCDMETEAAANAIKRATMYFHENQKLKGDNQGDVQINHTDVSLEGSYETIPELEILNQTNSDLRTKVASLTTQLGKECEKYEMLMKDLDIVKNLYKQEMEERKCAEEKLKSMESLYHSLMNNNGSKVNSESLKKESNLETQDSSEKASLCGSSPTSTSSIEEDLKEALAETEKQKNILQNKVKELEKQMLNVRLNGTPAESLYIPPPPPPPPPSFNPIKSFITFINAGKKTSKKASLPIKDDTENERHKAMSEMMNAIKSGNIQLKPVQKKIRDIDTTNSEPVALVEMKNILETLKKRERSLPEENIIETQNCFFDDINTEKSRDSSGNLNENNDIIKNNEMSHKSNTPPQETDFNSRPSSQAESPESLAESLDGSINNCDLSTSIHLSDISNCSKRESKQFDSSNDGDFKVEDDSEDSFVI